jgi:signal transduction histidine kinase
MGQALAALTMILNRLQRESSAAHLSAFEDCLELVNAVTADIRNLSYLFHPPLIDELGLPSVVREYAQGFQNRSGVRVQVEVSHQVGRLGEDRLRFQNSRRRLATFIAIPAAQWQILQYSVTDRM